MEAARLIDTWHLGLDRVIGVWERDGILVDPGPSSTIDRVLAELSGGRPRALLLTHIHLDHAGATGALVERFPDLPVYVHEAGAPHLADPARLLRSAARLYGERMDELWGPVLAVPERNLIALSGGEVAEGLEVLATPGHASHHVVYVDSAAGDAYVGDVGGVRIPPGDTVWLPTPPPDIDLESWRVSADRILEWQPSTLFLTHFGPVTRVRPHLAELFDNLALNAAAVRESLNDSGTDEEKSERFAEWLRQGLRKKMTDAEVDAYVVAAGFKYQWFGLARYWRKRLGM